MKERVLIVDDEAICGLYLSVALEAEGFDVRTALSADEAVLAAEDFKPDVLISDWMLRDSRDGLYIAEQLTDANPQLRVIFITGMDEDIFRSKAEGLEKASLVIKPVDLEDLLRILRGDMQSPVQLPQ